MARSCPICVDQPLRPVQASDVEVDVCPRCQGMWFDAGELERFPERPALRPFLPAARQAPSRCRKHGHQVPRSLAACTTCRSAPVSCPGCGSRLSLVTTRTCTIDVCVACEGVWLDSGDFELLEGVKHVPVKATAAVASGWEIPEATATGPDPWAAPGAQRPLPPSTALPPVYSRGAPLTCTHCGAALQVREAWAYDGDIYCAVCRPAGAVSGKSLPKDPRPEEPEDKVIFGGKYEALDEFVSSVIRFIFR